MQISELALSVESVAIFEQISAMCLCILAGADGDNENVNGCGEGDSDGDGDGDGNSTESMLAITMLASKLVQTERVLFAKALETQFSISLMIALEMLHVWQYGSRNNGSKMYSQLNSPLCSYPDPNEDFRHVFNWPLKNAVN